MEIVSSGPGLMRASPPRSMPTMVAPVLGRRSRSRRRRPERGERSGTATVSRSASRRSAATLGASGAWRGTGGWEMLAIDLASPYLDERDLLVPGQPELREYRLQWYDAHGPNGDFSPVQTITVSP